MNESANRAVPPDLAEAGHSLEKAAKAVRTWATDEIKAIEVRRDEDLHRLEEAIKVLGIAERTPSAPPPPPPASKRVRKRRRSKRPATTSASARERRERSEERRV